MTRALLALALLLACIAPASAQTILCTSLAVGATQDITGPGGPCRRITNGGSNAACIMTANSTTWTEFVTKGMSGLTLSATCSCTSPWSTTVNSGSSVTAYSTTLGSPSCPSESRTCTNGSLSGSYTNQSCTVGCAASQTVNWSSCSGSSGAVLTHGSSRSVSNTNGGYTGSVTVTCSAGSLNQSGASCAATCGGYSYGGYCYRMSGANGASCDTVCASYGGCNAAGTAAIGTSGSAAACTAVATGVLGYAVTATDTPTGGVAIGCSNTTGIRRFTASATTCAATYTGFRFCACNN